MSLVIPANTVNWIITITNSAGGLSSTSHVAFATSMLAALDQTITDRVANLFRDGLKGAWDNGWSVGPVKALQGPAPYAVFEDTATEVGTATAAVYSPPAVALVVSKKTGLAGKGLRGRVYLPGVPETLVDEAGVIDPTYLASMQTLMNNLRTSINGDAAVDEMVLLHDEASPLAGARTSISSFLVRNIAASQRPRQRR